MSTKENYYSASRFTRRAFVRKECVYAKKEKRTVVKRAGLMAFNNALRRVYNDFSRMRLFRTSIVSLVVSESMRLLLQAELFSVRFESYFYLIT